MLNSKKMHYGIRFKAHVSTACDVMRYNDFWGTQITHDVSKVTCKRCRATMVFKQAKIGV